MITAVLLAAALAQPSALTYTQPQARTGDSARVAAPQRYSQMGQEGVLGGTVYSVDKTPLGQLANDPRARRILDEELPGLVEHPSFREISGNPLSRIIPPGQMAMSPQKLQSIQARLDSIR